MRHRNDAPVRSLAAGTGAGESDRRAGLSASNVSHLPADRQLRANNGAVVAHVCGDCLCKSVNGPAHFLRQPPAIAFDLAILNQADELGAVWVEVRDRSTGRLYRATLETFLRHGVRVDRGHGLQLALPFGYWRTTAPGAPVQLNLF